MGGVTLMDWQSKEGVPRKLSGYSKKEGMVQFEIPDHGIVNDNKNSDAWSLLAYVPVPPFWQLDMENTAQVDSAHKNLGLPLHHFHHIVLLSCPFSHLLGHRGYPAIDRQKYQPVAAGLEAQNPILAEHSLAPRAGRQGLHRHRHCAFQA
mmetsp:Transcript_7609/g.18607  ORF Transcript_7609/g.18607 Transcript_7609/m.18607 type:complete len:150 (-) Transcript_7609:34-483(-)